LGWNLLLEPVVKITAMLALWWWLPNAHAAVLGLLASVLIAFVFTGRFKLERLWPVQRHAAMEVFAQAALTVAVAQAVMQNADVMLARAFLQPVDAGVYAAVGLVGRAMVATTWAINAAVFPIVARRAAGGGSHSRVLWLTVAVVALLGAGVTLFCVIVPSQILGVLLGEAYRSGASWLGLYALAATFGAISSTVSNHLLAVGRRSLAAGLPIVGALLQVALMLWQHDSAMALARAQLMAMGVLGASGLLLALCETWKGLVGKSDSILN
jgi:O-antigen/teichoic acid export membrane protein